MEIKIVTPKQIEDEKQFLLKEAQRLLKKIARLNGLYNNKIAAITRKLAALELL